MATEVALYVGKLATERRFLEMRPWHDFYVFLGSLGVEEEIPLPLVLAANIASPSRKLARLEDQLRWAERNGVLEMAATYLDSLSDETWSVSSEEHWARESEFW